MSAARRLWVMDQARPRKILVVGDAMLDLWFEGAVHSCQDSCPKFVSRHTVATPGGAANAARSLFSYRSTAHLISPWRAERATEMDLDSVWAFSQVNADLCHHDDRVMMPHKTRYKDGSRIVFRHDIEHHQYNLSDNLVAGYRHRTLQAVQEGDWDAVLISDYDKGFLDGPAMRFIAGAAHRHDIPVVADAKRPPGAYSGAILKCNIDYADKYVGALCGKVRVITHGSEPPLVFMGPELLTDLGDTSRRLPPVNCVNHIGAGDCFAAVFTLALAHGMPLEEASRVAHHAGRVYVQHPFSRPPWPFEVVKDMEPVAGKCISAGLANTLKLSLENKKIVFANGVFRIPHAGHADMLAQARAHGDVLVVGINDDVSAYRQKPGQYVMPLEQRVGILAGLACVDWVIPFAEDTPEKLLENLGADVLAKGEEYRSTTPPGVHLVKEVVFIPERVKVHASALVAAIREG